MLIRKLAAPFLIYQKIMEDHDIHQTVESFVGVSLLAQMIVQQPVWTFPVDPGRAAITKL